MMGRDGDWEGLGGCFLGLGGMIGYGWVRGWDGWD